MLTNSHKGYVDDFDNYAHDLSLFITGIVTPLSSNEPPYLLAHSMGGAITLRMIQLYPKIINKAALLSPMISINTGILPKSIAIFIITLAKAFNQLLSKESWYFVGQTNYTLKAFNNNKFTHSKSRFKGYIELYEKIHSIQLGGVTIQWLQEAFKAEYKIFENIDKIKTPLCIFQSSNDTIVDNQKQNDFCKRLATISPQLINNAPIQLKGANHELLFETDDIRKKTLNKVLQFFIH